MKINDLRKPQTNKVPFSSLKLGDVYEDGYQNIYIKTSRLLDGSNNCIYFDTYTGEWKSDCEVGSSEVFPLNVEINILS